MNKILMLIIFSLLSFKSNAFNYCLIEKTSQLKYCLNYELFFNKKIVTNRYLIKDFKNYDDTIVNGLTHEVSILKNKEEIDLLKNEFYLDKIKLVRYDENNNFDLNKTYNISYLIKYFFTNKNSKLKDDLNSLLYVYNPKNISSFDLKIVELKYLKFEEKFKIKSKKLKHGFKLMIDDIYKNLVFIQDDLYRENELYFKYKDLAYISLNLSILDNEYLKEYKKYNNFSKKFKYNFNTILEDIKNNERYYIYDINNNKIITAKNIFIED